MNKIEKEISNAVTGAADKIAENAHIAEATAHFEKLLREQLAAPKNGKCRAAERF